LQPRYEEQAALVHYSSTPLPLQPVLQTVYEEQEAIQRHYDTTFISDLGEEVGLVKEEEEEEEAEEEEEEDGWVDTVEGGNYVAVYGDLLDGYTTPSRYCE
jgi:hypothetical protein